MSGPLINPVSELAEDEPGDSSERAARPRGLPTWASVAIIVAVGAALLAVLWPREHGGSARPEPPAFGVQGGAVVMGQSAPQWRFVELAAATPADPLEAVPAPGRIVVDEARAAPVFSPVSGRVVQVSATLGQSVKAGARLVAVRSSQLPELERELESARAGLALKTIAGTRARDLVGLHALAEKEQQLAEQERRDAELALKAAEGKLRSLHVGAVDAGGFFWVSAPRAGIVVERHALVGQETGPDRSEPMLVIADLSEVLVVADVLETDAAGIRLGQKATVRSPALPAGGVEGKVEHIAEVVDPVRRTVGVRIRLDNGDRRLRPNGFVQVTFETGGDRRVVVPSEAVVTDDQRSVVFVQDAGGRLVRRQVQVGRSREGRTEILLGLQPRETYVTRGALLLLNALDLAR